MNTQATFRPTVIEALKTLWVALPVRAPGDVSDDARERQMAILDAYCFALSDCSNEAIWNTVNNLRAGKIEDASRDFCPKAPKLAEYARAEHRRLEAINRPKMVSYKPAPSEGFKDMRIVQRQITDKLASEGWFMAADNATIEKFRTGNFKVRSRHYWAIQEVWSPA